jgi:hypothetical protein
LPTGQEDQEQDLLDDEMKDVSPDQARLMRMIAQRKENERKNIDMLLTDSNSVVNVVAEQYYTLRGKKPGNQSPFLEESYNLPENLSDNVTEFLIKQSALQILQKVELDMMHTALDEYLENIGTALQISPDLENNQYLKQQQQLLLSSVGRESPTLDPQTIQQIRQQHQASLGGLMAQSQQNDFMDPMNNFPGPPQNMTPSTFVGKKQEEVMSELKRKYSGQVLQVAQSKKKKKNFQKDTSEHLNMWFFSNLHDPYPSDEVKKQLAGQTGLSLSQVNNWFGNKRIRYKRKMLEQNRRSAAAQGVDMPESSPPAKQRKRKSKSAAKDTDEEEHDQHDQIPPPMNSIFVPPQQPMQYHAQHQQYNNMGNYQYFNE